MAGKPLGSSVSRFAKIRDTQYSSIVFQKLRPPLDSELNLLQFAEAEGRAESIRAEMPSGWLMNELNPLDDYTTSPKFSNLFFFGRQANNELRSMPTAVVNGWVIPVAGTRTGQPPLNPSNFVTWNRVDLNPPNTSTGGNRAEFVFLEVWQQRIDVDPAPPGVAPGKPTRGFVYRFGNVESGFTHLKDELVDEELNKETTKRVQLQYRIRVVADVNVAQYPDGFDPSLVFANGPKSNTTLSFANMRDELGDPGLWRAGDGNPDTTGTVDGYVYAVPMCAVFRRNGAGFSDTGNLAGAFNRNNAAVNRNDSFIYTTKSVLPADITETVVQFTLTNISGTIFEKLKSFGEAFFKLDQEIIRVTNITQTGPTSYVVTIDRGQLQTTVRPHSEGTLISIYTVRPDGLYADQVTANDILDLRHSVADKFDYQSILKTSVQQLLKGNLRTTWKRYGSTNTSGKVVLYGDRITDGTVNVGGLSRLDGPSGNRKSWSDSIVTERYNVSVAVPTNTANVADPLQFVVAPYSYQVLLEAFPPIHGNGNRLLGSTPYWWNGDKIRIKKSEYAAGMPVTDLDQVRFVTPDEDPDAVLIHFEGMITDPNGGLPELNPNTIRSATVPNLTVTGNRILKHGQGLLVEIDPANGDMIITLNSDVEDTTFAEFRDALLDTDRGVDYAAGVLMHISLGVVYGAGRGMSHKPDHIHTVQYRGGVANPVNAILRPGLANSNRMIPTYVSGSPQVQTGRNRTYSETSEVMVDPGSKTVYVAPYKTQFLNRLMVRDGSLLNWHGDESLLYQGAMPTKSPDGSSTVHIDVDPLGLFYTGVETRYSEIPFDYLPKVGLHRIPIVPLSNSRHSSGINCFLLSKEGPITESSNHNKSFVSYSSLLPGHYIATAMIGETYGAGSGATSMFGRKVTRSQLRSHGGGSFQGIQFPPFIGPARITGIYLRDGSSVVPNPASPFNQERTFVGGSGKSVNLLKDDFDGATILVETDANGDATYIVSKDVIDFSKVPGVDTDTSTKKFSENDFLIECSVFAFDRGFLETNGRILLVKSVLTPVNEFITSNDARTAIITPAPLSKNSANNEVTVYYSRQPYQGDVFGVQNAYSDDTQKLGPLSISEATTVNENKLGRVENLDLPNKRGYEVLAALNFTTSLGSGRLSGTNPTSLLTKAQNPDGPDDVPGTLIDLHRRFSLNRVGYEDWETPIFPIQSSSFTTRPQIKRGGISELFDADLHPEFAGCVSALPLGIYFRDKDFLGKTLYQIRSSSNVGQVNMGTYCHTPYQAPANSSSPGSSTFEGTEFITGQSSNTSGSGGEKLILTDGTNNYGSNSIFKTTRGGAGWSVTGPWSGSPIASKMPKSKPNSNSGSVLVATAYLVRSQPENVNNIEVHAGHELQMVIVTQAIPSYFKRTDLLHSANGTGEGYTAIDRFRVWGRPLEKRRGIVNIPGLNSSGTGGDSESGIIPSDSGDIGVGGGPGGGGSGTESGTGNGGSGNEGGDLPQLGDPPIFDNDIYDDPVNNGSSDINTIAIEQEVLEVTSLGQYEFTISKRPLNANSFMLFRNGNSLQKDVDYVLTGATLQNLEIINTPAWEEMPALEVGEVMIAFYVVL